jgi:hypothetical protein
MADALANSGEPIAGVASVTAAIDAADKSFNSVIGLLLWMQPAKPGYSKRDGFRSAPHQ